MPAKKPMPKRRGQQKRIVTGQLLVGGLRVIASGLAADERIDLSTNGKAIPGNKVVPKESKIEPPPVATNAAPTPASK